MQKSKTEIKLIESAKSLFWKYGLKRVTVEEICQSAGVSKMSFYRSFKNKLAIAKEVLSLEIQESIDEFTNLYESDLSFIEKMEETIHLKLKHSDQIGMDFLHDILVHGGPEFQLFLKEKREETSGLVSDFLKNGQKNGDIRKDLDLDLIPYITEKLSSLASEEKMLEMYSSPRELIKEITTFFFYGIISHPRHP
jgi:AcrR family transcriptional regulator